ncbi:UvrD-helicase domain-containing protein [Microvirgula aerodenitrificans]|nr:UvrD-helicase domain-containing protein [Microvirgula aerodenitrificans]
MSEALDLFALQPQGVQLIEASAGTGKTWTLSSLAVRLVAEHGHAVSELLIVTYTKAATAELRDRIRQRMVDAHAVLGGEREPGSDAFLSRLPVALDTAGVSRERALRRLTYAIRTMDEAAVYTIHSFCQRVLTDRAFECAMPFDAELVPDENALIAELVDDAWRTTVVDRHPLIARYLAEQGENADVWRRLIARPSPARTWRSCQPTAKPGHRPIARHWPRWKPTLTPPGSCGMPTAPATACARCCSAAR